LKAKGATQQETRFEEFCIRNEILAITDERHSTSSGDICRLIYTRGIKSDADILIAATALVNGSVVATNNEEHFRRITGLHVENWQK
jgi:tRNA(fMet)-specific endonuclease VapC